MPQTYVADFRTLPNILLVLTKFKLALATKIVSRLFFIDDFYDTAYFEMEAGCIFVSLASSPEGVRPQIFLTSSLEPAYVPKSQSMGI